MPLWNVTILPEQEDALSGFETLRLEGSGGSISSRADFGEVRSAAVESADGPEACRLSMVVDAEDWADACWTACDAATRTLGDAVPFACVAEPLAS